MKKLIIGTLMACASVATFAAGESYHVYKFQMKAKTTEAKGVVANGCCGLGDEYSYRDRANVTIQGIIAGCGCEAINATENCKNAIVYMWDATHRVAITNIDVTIPWTVQRIGKKTNVIEHFARFKATYGDNDKYCFDVVLSGFGSYKDNTKDADLSYVNSIDGNFAGLANAGQYVKFGKCTACSYEPDEEFSTKAYVTCESCSEGGLSESDTSDVTPFFGTYTVRYDSSKSKSVSKSGKDALIKCLPSYVSPSEFVATTIGE